MYKRDFVESLVGHSEDIFSNRQQFVIVFRTYPVKEGSNALPSPAFFRRSVGIKETPPPVMIPISFQAYVCALMSVHM